MSSTSCSLCDGTHEVVVRPDRLIGATYLNKDLGDERLEACPICGPKPPETEIFCPVCGSPSMSLAVYWPGQPQPDENLWYCNGECQTWFPESICQICRKGETCAKGEASG